VKYTLERAERILEAVGAGATLRAAAAAAGIDESTLWRWQQRNAAFAKDLHAREAESEVVLVAIIRRAAETDWRAAMALLERRWPDTWGRRDRVDLDVYVRQRASELGLDPDEALAMVRPKLRSLGGA